MSTSSISSLQDRIMTVTVTNSTVKSAVTSFTMSKRYIREMMKASVISILYHRLKVDEKEFKTKSFNKVPFKCFRRNCKHPIYHEFKRYIEAFTDALQKGFLREFFLYFIDTNTGDILENYKFSFRYESFSSETRASHDVNALKEKTAEFLQTLTDLSQHSKLDGEVQVKVEFTYYEEYEPPGFLGVQMSESLLHKMSETRNSVALGSLFTGYHLLKCSAKGKAFGHEIPPSQQSNVLEVLSQPIMEEVARDDAIFTEDSDVIIIEEQPNNDKNRSSNSSRLDVSEMENVDCDCKLTTMTSNLSDKITCILCQRTFHTSCQGYLDNTFVKDLNAFCCWHCKDDDSSSIISGADPDVKMRVSRIKYILGVMYKYGKIPTEVKTRFPELTKKNIRMVFQLDGDVVNGVNVDFFNNLFKFEHKKPDFTKFKHI